MTLEKNNIYQGDCVQLLQKLDEGSVDLVFADPPFNIGYDYDVYDDTRETEDYLAWCRQWMTGVHRGLKPEGTFWLAIGDEYAAELKIEAQKIGFNCRSWVIWYYTFGVNCRNGFTRSHTHLFHFVKDKKHFTFNPVNPRNRIPSARQLVYADARANPKGRLPDNTWIYRPQDAPESFRQDHDTWYFARVAGTFKERLGFHGCQMPEQLLGRIIRSCSNPLDLVLDPFSGSGTTACVAKKLGRQYLGFELSTEYATYVQERLVRTQVNDPLDGPEDPLLSAPKTSKGKQRKVVAFDRAVDDNVVRALEKADEHHSVEHTLANPTTNKAFVKECRQLKVPGHPPEWNGHLLRLQREGRLPTNPTVLERLHLGELDDYLFACEIALQLLAIDFQIGPSEILCTPDYAEVYDELAGQFAPGFDSQDYRLAALAIHRADAGEEFDAWKEQALPEAVAITDVAKLPAAGVYVLSIEQRDIYVGHTNSLPQRVEQILTTPAWQELGVTHLRFIPAEQNDRRAVQQTLAKRLQTFLNIEHHDAISE